MNKKILCVDDEPNVLDGLKRTLRKDFDVHTAESGEIALEILRSDGPFAVVISDMRMPGLNGIQFLRRAKDIAPESVKMMLTGNADQQTAMDAVNEGSIFRFLNKPCVPETLVATLNDGIEQYRLLTLEKHLLEQTLNKSLEVLVEILAIVNPTAFSRSTRTKKMARQIADSLGLDNAWEVEAAAMLSQIGCVTVPEETLIKIATGAALSDKETGLYYQHPGIGQDLISQIPRMARVSEMIANQNRRIHDEPALTSGTEKVDPMTQGARILKVVLDFDKLINSGNSDRNAFARLHERVEWYDPVVLEILKDITEITHEEMVEMRCHLNELRPGMLLEGPLMSNRGTTLLSSGHEITRSLILRLVNLAETGIIGNEINVITPKSLVDGNEVFTISV